MAYKTFTRTWWRRNKDYPEGREPSPGRKHGMGKYDTEEEARAACQEWNNTHEPGFLSRKMEYEEA